MYFWKRHIEIWGTVAIDIEQYLGYAAPDISRQGLGLFTLAVYFRFLSLFQRLITIFGLYH